MPIPSEVYDRAYFLSDRCEGYSRYRQGHALSQLKRGQVDLLAPLSGLDVLDAGCGRGEVLRACAKSGAHVTGIDYSSAAVEIARETLAGIEGAAVQRADVTALDFEAERFDRILFGDVIEHLEAPQADAALAELHRVLRPGGRLVVHTAPNRLFLRYAWPLARPLLRLLGARRQAAEMHAWIRESKRYHVNEQSPQSLRRALRAAGFGSVRVWVDPDVVRGGDHHLTEGLTANAPARAAARVAAHRPFSTVLGNDLFAVAER